MKVILVSSIYDFSTTSLQGQPLELSSFKDKVVLIVNTASKCGFTTQSLLFLRHAGAVVR